MLLKPDDQEIMSRHNRKIVLEMIRKYSPISRAEIAKIIGMSPTSVTRIVSGLMEQGLIAETSSSSTGVGRKAVNLAIIKGSLYTLGVQIDRECIRIALVDFANEIVDRDVRPYSDFLKTPPIKILDITSGLISDFIEKHPKERSSIVGIGVGISGSVDNAGGELRFSAQMAWPRVPIREILEDRHGLPVFVDSSVKCRAVAETSRGVFNQYSRVVYFTVGGSVGAALVVDGAVMRGDQNTAGEIGHIIIHPYGRLCDCMRRGCLKTMLVDWALIQDAEKYKEGIKSFDDIYLASTRGEFWAQHMLHEVIDYLGVAIGLLTAAYNPQAMVLGGSLFENYNSIYELAVSKYNETVYEPLRDSCAFYKSKCAGDATFLGAAILAMDTYLNLE